MDYQLTREEAIKLYNSNWWNNKTELEVVMFQLNQERLCLPINTFKVCLDKVLGRGVWSHELANPKLLME